METTIENSESIAESPQAAKGETAGRGAADNLVMTVREAAALLGCHKATVYRLIYTGQLRICRAFGRMRIPRAEINRLVSDIKPYEG